MSEAGSVRRFLRSEHRDLLATALLFTGDRAAAERLVEQAMLRVLRHRRAGGLSAVDVRDEMARQAASGRVPVPAQVVDAGLPAVADAELAALASALEELTPAARAVAVLRLAEGLTVDETTAVLGRTAEDVDALERYALARLEGTVGGAERLPDELDALASLPFDDGSAERAADAVLARRRGRRAAVALAAAAVLAAVPLTVAGTDRLTSPASPTEEPAARPVAVFIGPARGSLGDDAGFLEAARRVPWGTDDDPHVHSRRVVYAADTAAGRVVLVVGDTPSGLEGAWLLGPRGAPAGQLAAFVPERIGRTHPAAVLVQGDDATAIVVVAAPGDTVEFSPRLRSEQSGDLVRDWAAVPAEDGIAVVQVADPATGRAAAVRVIRGTRVAARPAVADPGGEAGESPPLTRKPLRPSTAQADPILLGEAAALVARPFGVDPGALPTNLLWSGELPRTGRLGSVVVLVARVPGTAHVVLPLGRVGPARGGLAVPCGTTSFPAEVVPPLVTVATVCSVSDGSDSEPDRTWLLVTAPPDAVSADVLDEGGDVLDVLPLEGGAAITRTPDGAAHVRVADGDGRTLDVVPVAPPPEVPFGDYGER